MKKFFSLLLALGIILSLPVLVFAHGGRTDAQGGHRDNNNVSGLGPYHFHHGYRIQPRLPAQCRRQLIEWIFFRLNPMNWKA